MVFSHLVAQCLPTSLNLTYEFDNLEVGETVNVTWNSNCDSAIMNISLISLPPLPYQVQQVDNGVLNTGSRPFTIATDLLPGEYQFYIEDQGQNIWAYGDTFLIDSMSTICTIPENLELTYDLGFVRQGDTVDVTWDSNCDSATMNISLVSLPPLPYQVQQVDNGILNTGFRTFTIGRDIEPGKYQFYIEDEGQNIWNYGDTFFIDLIYDSCVYPKQLELTYNLEVVETGETVQVTWNSDCDSVLMNISLVSLPPLPFQVQQVDNGISNTGSRPFTIGADLEVGEYQFYIEDEGQNIWNYGDTFLISTPTTALIDFSAKAIGYYDPLLEIVKFDNLNMDIEFYIYDYMGRSMLAGNSSQGYIDVSQLPKNVYFIRGGNGFLLKFVKN